ncbi:P-loop containing nucleoside triphosphate hydrolase protein [Chytriomyces cf. hyalinus JEL632]|nr:P-loop containing nucleoside triphosphate hydrolase protein [Chytriomyces cf. hyalinus JEL632]
MQFSDLKLPQSLLHGLYGMGFRSPSKIQEHVLPILMANPPRNLITQSQSGTGKTVAFSLAMLYRVDKENPALQAICLSPTRELAKQITSVINEMGKLSGVTAHLAIKDMKLERGTKLAAQIIVGTSGTVMDFLGRKVLDASQCKIFVLDEADNMINIRSDGEEDHTMEVYQYLPKNCQILLFSATWSDQVYERAQHMAPDAVTTLRLRDPELTLKGIKQLYMDCTGEDAKIEVLMALYGLLTIGQSIVFVRSQKKAEEIVAKMEDEGHVVGFIHGALTGFDRDKIMDNFRAGRSKVIVTTNVLARGINILQVNLIINFDMPIRYVNTRGGGRRKELDFETYLHRIGRTGRFGRAGLVINFVHDEQSFDEMMEIQRHFETQNQIVRIKTDSYDILEKMLKLAMKGKPSA